MLSYRLCCVCNNGLHICIYTSCLLKIVLVSNGEKTQGHFASSLWPLVVSWSGILVFIQATQVQFLSRELRFLFRTAHCCLSKIMIMCFSVAVAGKGIIWSYFMAEWHCLAYLNRLFFTVLSPLPSSLLYGHLSFTILSPLPSSLLYRPLSSPRSCLAVLVIVPRAANVTEVQLSSEQQ